MSLFFPMNECNLCLFFFKIILYIIKYCHAPSSNDMNWACDNSHKPIDTVSVSSVPGKYTIPAIKPVLLQNIPKKKNRLYGPSLAVLASIDILACTIKKK